VGYRKNRSRRIKPAISPKLLKIERKLLLAACLKSYNRNRLVPKCITLKDLWARFKVTDTLNAAKMTKYNSVKTLTLEALSVLGLRIHAPVRPSVRPKLLTRWVFFWICVFYIFFWVIVSVTSWPYNPVHTYCYVLYSILTVYCNAYVWELMMIMMINGWLGSVVVGRQTRDREVASSTPGRCTAG